MPLPYYAKHRPDMMEPYAHLVLNLVGVIKELRHMINRPVGLLPYPHIMQLIAALSFAESVRYHKPRGVYLLKSGIETYLEVVRIVAALNKYREMAAIYTASFAYLTEGQHDLYLAEQQLTAAKDKTARLKALLEKYHTIHEGNLRHTVTLAVYCIDCISGNADAESKLALDYCTDDLSKKVKKLEDARRIRLMHDVCTLTLGADRHVRNAISHRTFRYTDKDSVVLRDRTWERELSSDEVATLVEAIELNLWAQIAALTMFAYEYQDKLDFTGAKKYASPKQLRMLIHEAISDSFLTAKNVELDEEQSRITCDVTMSSVPTEVFGRVLGVHFTQHIPTLNVEDQALRVAECVADLRPDYEIFRINVFDDAGGSIGSVEVRVSEWVDLIERKTQPIEFKQRVLLNTFEHPRKANGAVPP